MDPDLELVWGLFRPLFPHFSVNHFVVWRLLWRIEPKGAEFLIQEAKLARATVYKILKDLLETGLIKKTNFKPISYFSIDPVKAFCAHSQKILVKLKKGKEKLCQLVKNSSGLGGELYLVERDGGQKRLVNKQTHQTILDEFELRELKKVVEEQIKEAEQSKLKAWAIYK